MAGRFQVFAGRLDEAVAHFERALDLSPEHTATHWWLAFTHAFRGEDEVAASTYPLADVLSPARAALREGERGAFREGFTAGGFRLGVRSALEWHIADTGLACTEDPSTGASLLAWLGETERMYLCLEECIRERRWPAYALVSPFFTAQRGEPRFGDMLGGQGLPRTAPAS